MSEQDILKILKIDLQVSVNALDEYLLFLISSAKEFILKEGITPVSYTHLDVYKRQTQDMG